MCGQNVGPQALSSGQEVSTAAMVVVGLEDDLASLLWVIVKSNAKSLAI